MKSTLDTTPSDTLIYGCLAGLFSGGVMAIVVLVHSWAIGQGFWTPLFLNAAVFWDVEALISGPSVALVGLALHFIISLFFGCVFALFNRKKKADISAMAALVRGLVFGVGIWLFMNYGVLPFSNPVLYERVNLTPLAWFIDHLIFGAALCTTPIFKQLLFIKPEGFIETEPVESKAASKAA